MPSVSKKQQKLMGIAYGVKKGKVSKAYSPEATKIAEEMSAKKLKEFASKVKKKGK